MIINSSRQARDIIDNAPFEVGIAYIPHPETAERQGVVVGGASLWLVDNGDEAEQEEAESIALEAVPGTIIQIKLDEENNFYYYEWEMMPSKSAL